MQLLSVRAAIRKLVLSEIDLLGGDPKKVAIMGHSQGGCVAYDVALSLPVTIGGLFASRCHLYSCSAAGTDTSPLPSLLRRTDAGIRMLTTKLLLCPQTKRGKICPYCTTTEQLMM